MPNNKTNQLESRNMTKYNNDPFGFQKAVNPLDQMDKKVLDQIAKIFERNEKTEEPNISYKKAVNNLKSKVRFK